MNDHLRIRPRPELVLLFQLSPELLVVVDLPVAHERQASVLTQQRLRATRDVDDRQPLVSHGRALGGMEPRIIGSAMP